MIIRVYKRMDTGTYEIKKKVSDRRYFIINCQTCDEVLEKLQEYPNISIEFVNEEEIYAKRFLGRLNS